MKYEFDIGGQIVEWFKRWVKTDEGQHVFKEALDKVLEDFRPRHDFREIQITNHAGLMQLKDRTAPIFIDKETGIIYSPVINADFFKDTLDGTYVEVEE